MTIEQIGAEAESCSQLLREFLNPKQDSEIYDIDICDFNECDFT